MNTNPRQGLCRDRFHAGTMAGVLIAAVFFSGGASHALAAAPVITGDLADATRFVGETVTLSVTATSDSPIRYQWYFGSSPLAQQTNPALTLVGLVTNLAGNYYVEVANNDASTFSRTNTLTVAQPDPSGMALTGVDNMTSFRGQNGRLVNVTVTASATSGSIWGTDIYTDDSSLRVAAVHAGFLADGQVGTLQVEVLAGQSSYAGTTRNGVTSFGYGPWTGSYRIVQQAPTFQQPPLSRVAWSGTAATFTSQVLSPDPLSFQWLHNGQPMPQQNAATLNLSRVTVDDGGTYALEAWSNTATNTSEPATFVVVDPTPGDPAFAAPGYANGLPYLAGAVHRILVTGATNALGLVGSGIYALDSALGLAAVHSGLLAPGEQGTLAVLMLPGAARFRGTTANGVTSSSRDFFSPAFGLLALTPTITAHPVARGVLRGGTVSFQVTATSRTLPLDYQWRRDGVDLPGKTNSSLTLGPVVDADGGAYDVVVGNPDGVTVSYPAPVLVPSVDTVPQPAISPCSAANGAVLFATVVGTTNGSLWGDGAYTCDSGLAVAAVHAGVLAPGQTGAVSVAIVPGQSQYLGTTRNGVTSLPYGAWSLSYEFLGLAPYITVPPQNQSVLVGDTATFAVSASSSAPIQYQWLKGSDPLPGKTGNTLVLPLVVLTNAGQYRVMASNSLGFVFSAPATLTVGAEAGLQLATTAPGLVSLEGTPGANWQVQAREDLNSGAWAAVSNVFLNTSPLTIQDPDSTNKPTRFYRAQRLP